MKKIAASFLLTCPAPLKATFQEVQFTSGDLICHAVCLHDPQANQRRAASDDVQNPGCAADCFARGFYDDLRRGLK